MDAIIGMPRSGTSFCQKILSHFGHEAKPSVYTDDGPRHHWGLMEPHELGRPLANGARGAEVVDAIKRIENVRKADANGARLLIKQPQLCFYRNELLFFDRVVVCLRELDSWIESAKRYQDTVRILSDRPKWLAPHQTLIDKSPDKLKQLGYVWRSQALASAQYLRDHNRDVFVFEFSDKGVEKFLNKFKIPKKFHNEILTEYWHGSRWVK